MESYYDFDEDYWADVEPVEPEPVPNEPPGDEETSEPPGEDKEPEADAKGWAEEAPDPEDGPPEQGEETKDQDGPSDPEEGGKPHA
jgi:hypothetical protein